MTYTFTAHQYDPEEDPSGDLVQLHPDSDDISQEMDILRWQGKNPSRAIVLQRLSIESGLTFSTLGLLESVASTPWEQHRVNLKAIEDLTTWALNQTENIQTAIWEFLENPEQELESTLVKLADLNVIEKKEKPKKKRGSGSLSDVLTRALPATKSELIELTSALITNKRPDATVRQFLRRRLKQHLIHEVDGVYYKTKELLDGTDSG